MTMKLTAVGAGLALITAVFVASPANASDVSPHIGLTSCTWYGPDYPHVSSDNFRKSGAIDIKTAASGVCEPSPDPVVVTAQVFLEKQVGGGWVTAMAGAPVSRNIQGTVQKWFTGQLFAVMPCVPGVYRGRLTRTAEVDGGIAGVIGPDYYSPAVPVDCKTSHISMVIDDTGSMGNVIGSVSASLSSFIQSRPDDEYTKWSLTTFKDSPTSVGTTEDRDQALGWVNALTASGGGDCPEDALGGISSGLNALGTDRDVDKQMIVATDASAHGGDVNGIIAAAQASGTHVNVLLAGDCDYPAAVATAATTLTTADYPYEVSSQVVLRQIAEATGGKYFFIPSGTTADFTAALNAIFASIADTSSGSGDDIQPPTVTLSGVPSTIWSPNHKMQEVTPTISATDNEDPSPAVSLVGVEVNQSDDGQGDGSTAGDVEVTADGRIFVRAERSARGGARTYTITYRATDRSGNTGFGSATVVVPKDQSGK